MKLRIENLWKEKEEFFSLHILTIGQTDMQCYIVLFNFSFILEV